MPALSTGEPYAPTVAAAAFWPVEPSAARAAVATGRRLPSDTGSGRLCGAFYKYPEFTYQIPAAFALPPGYTPPPPAPAPPPPPPGAGAAHVDPETGKSKQTLHLMRHGTAISPRPRKKLHHRESNKIVHRCGRNHPYTVYFVQLEL